MKTNTMIAGKGMPQNRWILTATERIAALQPTH